MCQSPRKVEGRFCAPRGAPRRSIPAAAPPDATDSNPVPPPCVPARCGCQGWRLPKYVDHGAAGGCPNEPGRLRTKCARVWPSPARTSNKRDTQPIISTSTTHGVAPPRRTSSRERPTWAVYRPPATRLDGFVAACRRRRQWRRRGHRIS